MSEEKQAAAHTHARHDSETRTRLPTLLEVLNRRTLPPVDLYSFYIYMRDQQQSVDYLDFWLDVSQHMSLCRCYVRQLRRSVLMGTPEPSVKASTALEAELQEDLPSSGESNAGQTAKRVSAVLRAENASERSVTASAPMTATMTATGTASNAGHLEEGTATGTGTGTNAWASEDQLSSAEGGSSAASARFGDQAGVARADIRASAERILYTYLLPSSEREVVLPENLVEDVLRMVEVEQRDDPEVFDATKDYVFQAMERDAFPGFLESKALGNLVPPSIFLRLIISLVCFFGGFWAAFYCVLSEQSRHIRCWVILPFFFAAYFVTSYQYKLDPIIAFAGYSEYTFMTWAEIKEPFVRSLLFKRAWANLVIVILMATALSVLFIFVPGKHI
ncbi:Bud site selection protein, Revert to axial protein 1 [Ascosphaera acerosa]|nr:Bud site selection protein, Revert to axial protein 1 [Ascosphaera acerosa]